MDRRTQADRDGGKSLPQGQTSRGYPASTSRNPKNNSQRRPDVTGSTGPGLVSPNGQTEDDDFTSGYPGGSSANRFSKGSGSTEPSPANINRGYSEVTPGNVPRISKVTSANRQNFGIDPGTPPQPDGDSTDGPQRPHFGVGTTGE